MVASGVLETRHLDFPAIPRTHKKIAFFRFRM